MKWIWCDRAEGINQYADFVREFNIDEIFPNATITICTEGEYVLYINDSFVECGQFDDMGNTRTYDEISISDYLKKGKNKLFIGAYHQGESSYQYSVGEAGLCYEIKCGEFSLCSDKDTLSSPSFGFEMGSGVQKTTSQYGYGYVYNAKNAEESELLPSCEKEMPLLQKRPIRKCEFFPSDGELVSQGTFIRSGDKENPGITMDEDKLSFCDVGAVFEDDKKSLKINENIFAIYDFGEEKSGYLIFEIEAEEGTIVDIGYCEHLNDGKTRTKIGERCFANRYICKNGVQSFTYYYRRIAGRFVQLNIFGKVSKINHVGIINSLYPTTDDLEYDTGNELFNKIIDVSKYTLKMCMHEHYEDCPWREQALYGSDSRNQMLFGYYAFGECQFVRASLELIAKSAGDDGFITITSPSDAATRIPSFTYTWLLAMKEYIEYSADITLAQKYSDLLKRITDKRLSEIENGIAKHPIGENYWNFYEWSDFNDGLDTRAGLCYDADGLYNLFFYMGLNALSDVFEYIGENEYCEKIRNILSKVKDRINELFFDEEKGVYASFLKDGKKIGYSELTQSIAVFSGVSGDRTDRILKILSSQNNLVPITLGYLVYKYDALLGESDTYKDYVYDEILKKWGRMIEKGATTFWETEKGESDFDNAGSLCHAWSSAPVYVYGRYFLD
ncbi:MAG: family 78 glycoside hydrolase catalytic domain [Clostridia bacterium]|nr:family 78 glycoside hydrolase catalytic domain [Clostridia bacterium]